MNGLSSCSPWPRLARFATRRNGLRSAGNCNHPHFVSSRKKAPRVAGLKAALTRATQIAAEIGSYGLVHADPLFLRRFVRGLRQRQFEHAIAIFRVRPGLIDFLAKRESTVDLAVMAFGAQHRALLILDVFF